jgi:hypothetical protein
MNSPITSKLEQIGQRVVRWRAELVVTWSLAAILGVVCALGLSACGRRGALDPPPTSTATGAAQNFGAPEAEAGQDLPPNKPFFLDFLI